MLRDDENGRAYVLQASRQGKNKKTRRAIKFIAQANNHNTSPKSVSGKRMESWNYDYETIDGWAPYVNDVDDETETSKVEMQFYPWVKVALKKDFAVVDICRWQVLR